MAGDGSKETGGDVFSLLLHPSAVAVIDLFRSKSELEFTHDLTLVEDAELELSRWTSRAFARAVVSEAILLAFSLARERLRPMAYQMPGSRRASPDERDLIALVSASWVANKAAAVEEATRALGVPADGLSSSAAENLASQVEQAGLHWPSFSLAREAVVSAPADSDVWLPVASPDDAAFKFKK